jgi:hypothetical protein
MSSQGTKTRARCFARRCGVLVYKVTIGAFWWKRLLSLRSGSFTSDNFTVLFDSRKNSQNFHY